MHVIAKTRQVYTFSFALILWFWMARDAVVYVVHLLSVVTLRSDLCALLVALAVDGLPLPSGRHDSPRRHHLLWNHKCVPYCHL